MTNNFTSSPMKNLWQSQPTEPQGIAVNDLRRKMNSFERKIFWRNIREYLAGAFVVVVFGYYEWKFPTLLLRIGSGLIIAGTLYAMYQLHRRGRAKNVPATMALNTCLDFQRGELERQRDALRSAWRWYLLPFVPGLCVFLIGLFQFARNIAEAAGRPSHPFLAALFLSLFAAFVATLFFAIWKLNKWAANKLQAQIDELNALACDPK